MIDLIRNPWWIGLLCMRRPPMKEGVAADEIGLLLEGETAVGLDRFQRLESFEALIGQRLIGERPEMFGRLQFRGIRREKEEVDALRHLDLVSGMPPCAIEHHDDPLGPPGANVAGKGCQHPGKERCRHGRQEPPLGLARGGADEATEIEPLVALLDGSDRPLSDGCPHPADEGEQADAMFVGGPQFHGGAGMRCPDLLYLGAELS